MTPVSTNLHFHGLTVPPVCHQDDVLKTDSGLHVTFTEKDATAAVPVDYTGTLPDIFKPGITVVAEGKLGRDGVFHARTLLAKCPSRFSTTTYTQ